jgi:pilus assembly protein Flp/PilA
VLCSDLTKSSLQPKTPDDFGCSRTAEREQRVVHQDKLEGDMRQASQLIKKLKDDEKGAALVEYTVLLGVMLVAVISTIMLVGGWVSTKWSALWTALQGN